MTVSVAPTATLCYHKINGPTAESLLATHGVEGAFLLRPSSKSRDGTGAQATVLSVLHRAKVIHVKIVSNGEVCQLEGDTEQFASPFEIIQHYTSGKHTLNLSNHVQVRLSQPIFKDNPVFLDDRWFHRNINGKRAAALLDGKSEGSFLIRLAAHGEPLYVISMVGPDNKVVHVQIRKGQDSRGQQKFHVSQDSTFVSVQELVSFYKERSMVDSNGIQYKLKKPVNTSSLKATTIKHRINDLGHSEEGGFSDEYMQLTKFDEDNRERPKTEGFKAANRNKNRFKNILPYDETRVKLTDTVEPPLNDYVNANYIRPDLHLPNHNVYIASQGPLQATVVDFWRMVWQEKVEVIVMTTKEVEGGKSKCAKYWSTRADPVKQVEIGESGGAFIIRYLDETLKHDYTLTKLEVSHSARKEPPRLVYHFQYLAWPDHSVPTDPTSILTLLRDMNQLVDRIRAGKPRPGPPIVVHCSAGIGRTGTFIVLDILINQLQAIGVNSDLDIFRAARNLRTQRSGMIQTEPQYRFVYMAILKYIENETNKSRPMDEVYCT
ncbi:hypothetical protein BOX15_Mlig029219g2 [Macrostomum lignano]|uniref:protein-tyrosine-phosphatase n=1 Tax=Macrostomum lignano TaxID=282301 RepID=A0A267FXF2_9PLAT|nr:hypothetical protein BOX15_Mlig029219g2 [Macrostomum lignano]